MGACAPPARFPGLEGRDSSRSPYAYDQARARRLLAEAGVASGLELRLWRSQRPEYARVAQAVQQSLGQVGVKLEIVERARGGAKRRGRPVPDRLVRRLSRCRELYLPAVPLPEQGSRRQLRLPGRPGARPPAGADAHDAGLRGEGPAGPGH
ncbi:MAG: ABC transporter substrate-binding protein [Gemmatimonadales bacterium]